MSKIKIIAMDVDGTLLSRDRVITERTKTALLTAQDRGIRLVLASGRPTAGLLELGQELQMDQHNGLFISYNGSKVIDCRTMAVLYNEPIPVAQGKAVLEHLKQFKVYPMIDRENYLYVNDVYADPIQFRGQPLQIIQFEARGGHYLLCEQADLAAFLDYEPNKILTAGEPGYLIRHYQEMMAPFKDSLNCVFTSEFYFEFTAKGIDKGRALEAVLGPMGYVPEEMIAFGDGMNDLSMIGYAGIGVAMGNAVPELKQAAQYVAGTNGEDGLAGALFHFIPELLRNENLAF